MGVVGCACLTLGCGVRVPYQVACVGVAPRAQRALTTWSGLIGVQSTDSEISWVWFGGGFGWGVLQHDLPSTSGLHLAKLGPCRRSESTRERVRTQRVNSGSAYEMKIKRAGVGWRVTAALSSGVASGRGSTEAAAEASRQASTKRSMIVRRHPRQRARGRPNGASALRSQTCA